MRGTQEDSEKKIFREERDTKTQKTLITTCDPSFSSLHSFTRDIIFSHVILEDQQEEKSSQAEKRRDSMMIWDDDKKRRKKRMKDEKEE